MIRSLLRALCALALAPLLFVVAAALSSAALAADTTVVIPWGNWLADILVALGGVLVLLVTWALRFLPAAVQQWCARLFGERVDQLLERAVQYGINATAGAVRGKTLSFDIGSEVARQAADYAIEHAPGIVKSIGGMTRLHEKIVARLDLEEKAAAPAVA